MDVRNSPYWKPETFTTPNAIGPVLERMDELEDPLEELLKGFLEAPAQVPASEARMAFFLLAHAQCFETWRTLLQVMGLPSTTFSEIFPDSLCPSLALALSHMALADFKSLKGIVRNRDLSVRARQAAMTALVIEAAHLPERRMEVVALGAELLDQVGNEPSPAELWLLFMEMIPLNPQELLADFQQAVRENALPGLSAEAGLQAWETGIRNPVIPWWQARTPFDLRREMTLCNLQGSVP